ncbi:MAG: alpha/beta hydrolase [Rhizobacter sp.]|nr:alpha/beta hydrolase [Ferruginibacter sp.]
MKLFLSVLVAVCFFIACKTPAGFNSKLPQAKIKDIAYGSFASSKMDVSLPPGRNSSTPFVIVIHGGAWVMGDKVWGSRTQDSLLAHGIASANINYRFADDSATHYPQLLADIDSAIRFCIAHAAEWNTRKKDFVITGESAGAHLALLYAYTYPQKINAVIAACAPTDLTDTALLNYYAKHDASLLQSVAKIAGAHYDPAKKLPAAFAAASPVVHVKPLPTLIFHGTNDWVVPYQQAIALEKALKDKGIIHRFIPMKDAGHDLGFNTPEGRAIIYREMMKWIAEYGK